MSEVGSTPALTAEQEEAQRIAELDDNIRLYRLGSTTFAIMAIAISFVAMLVVSNMTGTNQARAEVISDITSFIFLVIMATIFAGVFVYMKLRYIEVVARRYATR